MFPLWSYHSYVILIRFMWCVNENVEAICYFIWMPKAVYQCTEEQTIYRRTCCLVIIKSQFCQQGNLNEFWQIWSHLVVAGLSQIKYIMQHNPNIAFHQYKDYNADFLTTVPAEIIDTLTFSLQKIHNFLQKLCKWKHILVSTDVLIWFAEEHSKKLE